MRMLRLTLWRRVAVGWMVKYVRVAVRVRVTDGSSVGLCLDRVRDA